jgi:SpoVK/Ycf46/Vps4 family AAA+-type ATPase
VLLLHSLPVSWVDVGGYNKLKQRLQQALEWPLKHAKAFHRLGLHAPRGILLHGPPGEKTVAVPAGHI